MFKKYIERAFTMSNTDLASCLYIPATVCCEFFALIHEANLLWSVKENDDGTFVITDQMIPSIVFFVGTVDGKVLRNPDNVDEKKIFAVLDRIRNIMKESRG